MAAEVITPSDLPSPEQEFRLVENVPLLSYCKVISVPSPTTLTAALSVILQCFNPPSGGDKPSVRRPAMSAGLEKLLLENDEALNVANSTISYIDLGSEKLLKNSVLDLPLLRKSKANDTPSSIDVEGDPLLINSGQIFTELVGTNKLVFQLVLKTAPPNPPATLSFKRDITLDALHFLERPSTEWMEKLKRSSESLSIHNSYQNIWDRYGPHRRNINIFSNWATRMDKSCRAGGNLSEKDLKELDEMKRSNDLFIIEAEGYLAKIMYLMRYKITLSGLATPNGRFLPKDGSVMVDWIWRYHNWTGGSESMNLQRVTWEAIITSDTAYVPNNDLVDASKEEGYSSYAGLEKELSIKRADLAGQPKVVAWIRARYRHTFDWGDQIFVGHMWCQAKLGVLDIDTQTRFVQAFTLSGRPKLRLQGPYASVDWTDNISPLVKTEEFWRLGDIKWYIELKNNTDAAVKPISWDKPDGVTWFQYSQADLEKWSDVQVTLYGSVKTGFSSLPEIKTPPVTTSAKRLAPGTVLKSGESLGLAEYLQLILDGGEFEVRLTMERNGKLVLNHITPKNTRAVFSVGGNGSDNVKRIVMQTDGSLIASSSLRDSYWHIEPEDGKKQAGSSLAIRADGSMAIVSPDGKDLWTAGGSVLRDPSQTDRVQSGEALWVNQKLVSANGRYSLVLQADENLVVYDGTKPIWDNQGTGPGAHFGVDRLVVQDDDSVCIYGPRGTVPWTTGTARRGKGGRGSFILGDDGKVMFRSEGTILWSTDSSLIQDYEPLELVPTPSGSDRLKVGQYLAKGESLVSKNGRFALKLQQNGNLTLTRPSRPEQILWSTKTSEGITKLCFGNVPRRLGLWGIDGRVKWEPVGWDSRRAPSENASLVVGDDGKITFSHEVEDRRRKSSEFVVIWSSDTKYPAEWGVISSIGCGDTLLADHKLVSPNGQYSLTLTAQGGFRVVDSTNSSYLVVIDPLYKPNNASEAPLGLRFPAHGPPEIFDQNGIQRWSNKDERSDSFRLTDKGEVFLVRDGGVSWAVYPLVIPSLSTGGIIYRNQRLRSPDGGHELIFQSDGNLVLYQTPKGSDVQFRWASNTHQKDVYSLELQPDGNLVLYSTDKSRRAPWSSNSMDNSSVGKIRTLEVRNDGGLVLVQEGKVVKDLRS